MTARTDRKPPLPWRPLTRRAFVAMLGAAAATFAASRARTLPAPTPGDATTAPAPRAATRWIGHC